MEAIDQQGARAAPLRFTDAAAAKVGELITEEDNSDLMLRVFISGGVAPVFSTGSPSTSVVRMATRRSKMLVSSCWWIR